MIINNCYFCDEEPIDQPSKKDGDWFVECYNCGARGPFCHAQDQYDDYIAKIFAVRSWNKEEYDYNQICDDMEKISSPEMPQCFKDELDIFINIHGIDVEK